MEKSNETSLLFTIKISPSVIRLKAFKRNNKSNRAARLVLLLVIFAAAAFGLTATADSIGSNTGVGKSFDPVLDDPGILPIDNSIPSDQKAGSLLIFPVYTSLASVSNLQNSRINITNTDAGRNVFVHLFLIDGATCSVSDAYICLTANQTTSFLMSDLDPGITGYMIAVAVDANGCPTVFNGLIGDSYIKISGIHAANLGAIAVTGLPGITENAFCSFDSSTAQLNFDGVSYNPLPRVVAADNLPDRSSRNETMLVIDRIGGSLATSAAKLESIFGLLFDDAENVLSFSFNPNLCQFRSIISNNFPRTTPRYEQFISAGRSGWMKLWSFNDAAIVGAVINFNPNSASSAAAFNQGHNLHTMTLTNTASVTIPIFPPSC